MPFFPANAAQSVQLGDTVRLGMTFVNPSGTMKPFGLLQPVNSDVTPIWQSRINDSDTVTQTGNFTLRTGCSGLYRANFVASAANGYHAGDYVEVMASGRFLNVSDIGIVCAFVINGFQSGVWSAVQADYKSGPAGATLTFGSGLQASLGSVLNASVVAFGTSGLNTATYIADQVWNSLQASYTANRTFGSGLQTNLGAVINANLVQIGGSGVQLAGTVPANVTQISGLAIGTTTYVADQVWGALESAYTANGTFGSGLQTTIGAVINANLVQIGGSGLLSSTYIRDMIWNSLLATYNTTGTFGSGINKCAQDVYFADVQVKNNSPVPNNEYGVVWYKNALPVGSGFITNPAISAFSSIDGTALFQNKVMTYASTQLGALSYVEPTNRMASGIPYEIRASGLIDNNNQVWRVIRGLDFM